MHRVNKDRISITVPGVLRLLAAALRESKRHRWLNAGNSMFHHYRENDTLRRNTLIQYTTASFVFPYVFGVECNFLAFNFCKILCICTCSSSTVFNL